MFTGIVEAVGKVEKMSKEGSNITFEISSPISKELKVDQSVSHNGVCLTVTQCDTNKHSITAIDETLKRSNLGTLSPGGIVNLERCMKADGRFDGHIVQGHVDTVATVAHIDKKDGSTEYQFQFENIGEVMVDKGSITVNGVSLTCFETTDISFKVAIIPFTSDHTNFGRLTIGDQVNLEFDILGKYMRKLLAKQSG
ncbi:MAG: riboflavin synthase [Cyclobacteriaceae bacterium]